MFSCAVMCLVFVVSLVACGGCLSTHHRIGIEQASVFTSQGHGHGAERGRVAIKAHVVVGNPWRLEPTCNHIWFKQVCPKCCLVFWMAFSWFRMFRRGSGMPWPLRRWSTHGESRGAYGGRFWPLFSLLSMVAARWTAEESVSELGEQIAPAFPVLPVNEENRGGDSHSGCLCRCDTACACGAHQEEEKT